tara:strand:+ start:579 stop:704 length:126 start_codon:yes stop_codon:yes gene_type:complete
MEELKWTCPKLLTLKKDIIEFINECDDDEILLEIFELLEDE